MKSLQELYDAIIGSEALKKELQEAGKSVETLEAFLKAQGCAATVEEFKAFLKEKAAARKELSDEDLQSLAGGGVGEFLTSVAIALLCLLSD